MSNNNPDQDFLDLAEEQPLAGNSSNISHSSGGTKKKTDSNLDKFQKLVSKTTLDKPIKSNEDAVKALNRIGKESKSNSSIKQSLEVSAEEDKEEILRLDSRKRTVQSIDGDTDNLISQRVNKFEPQATTHVYGDMKTTEGGERQQTNDMLLTKKSTSSNKKKVGKEFF
jgi:hypothetical protein